MPRRDDNPFDFLGPVQPPRPGRPATPRVPREAERRAAAQALGRNHLLVVYSPPQSGLTTFLNDLEGPAGPSACVDLLNVEHAGEEDAELLAAARRAVEKAGGRVGAAPTLTDLLTSLPPDGPTTALVLDGIDSLGNAPARRAVLALRAAYTEARTALRPPAFRVVIGSHKDLREITAGGRTSPLNVAREIFLEDFTGEQIASLLSEGLGALADRTEVARWSQWALDLTGGQPFLTQVCGSVLFDRLSERAEVGGRFEADPDRLRGEVEEAAREHLSALAIEAVQRKDLADLLQAMLRGSPIPFDSIDGRIKSLQFLGLIARDPRGKCAIKGGLYHRALARIGMREGSGTAHLHTSFLDGVLEGGGPDAAGRRRCPSCGRVVDGGKSGKGGAEDPAIVCPSCGHVPLPQERAPSETAPTKDDESGETAERPSPAPASGLDARALPTAWPLPGENIGGCKLVRELGRGGMSRVFLARHIDMDRLVALKIVTLTKREDLKMVHRFLREARAAACVDHENVVPVYHVGREREHYYLSMQYLDGGSLGSRLRRGCRPDPAESVRIMIEAARGLSAAHARRIVHRDVKPDNVLFSGAGAVKVADFGLAAVLGSGSQLTEHGFVVGTPHYMSPEQCGGDPVDARSDIYSLGATMYHTLTGSEPFGGDSPMSVMLKHRSEPVRPPHKVNPDIPKDLSNLVLKAMSKNPDDRFQDADALVAALKELPVSRKD